MTTRRVSLALLLVALLLALGLWFSRGPRSPAESPRAAASAPLLSKIESPAPLVPVPGPATPSVGAEPVSAAAELNSPRYDIAHDLVVLSNVFADWRLDFPRTGHPFGENSEITAALTGDNPLRLALIPRAHPAINAQGELCDRWGTPFRFHALAGDRMELRSAGPDKKFGTADDALLTPP